MTVDNDRPTHDTVVGYLSQGCIGPETQGS